MAEKRGWDLTSTHSLQSAAGWLRKNAGPDTLFVCVVRVDDLAISADPALLPRDVLGLFENRLPELRSTLEAERTEALAKHGKAAEKAAKRAGR